LLDAFQDEKEVARAFFNTFQGSNVKPYIPKTDKQKADILKMLSKLMVDHDLGKDDFIELIRYIRQDVFWQSNFLSLKKLNQKDKNGVKYIDVFIAQKERGDNVTKNARQSASLDEKRAIIAATCNAFAES
jgi:hypothetical protein